MQLTTAEWNDIVKYMQNKLLQQTEIVHITGNVTKAVIQELTLIGTMSTLTLDNYIVASGAKKEKKKPVPVADDKGFEEFWKEYPATANFQYRGMSFTGSRVLRSNYQICEQLYLRGLQENNVTGEQVVGALKKQIQLMKEESYDSGQNKLQYMAAIEPYLRQQKYMAFIGIESVDEEYESGSNNCA